MAPQILALRGAPASVGRSRLATDNDGRFKARALGVASPTLLLGAVGCRKIAGGVVECRPRGDDVDYVILGWV